MATEEGLPTGSVNLQDDLPCLQKRRCRVVGLHINDSDQAPNAPNCHAYAHRLGVDIRLSRRISVGYALLMGTVIHTAAAVAAHVRTLRGQTIQIR